MLDVRYRVVMLMGYVVDWNCMSMDLEVTVQYVVKHWSGCGSWSLDGEGQ